MIRINLALKKGPVGSVPASGGAGGLSDLLARFKDTGGAARTSDAIQELAKEVLVKMLITTGVYFACDYALAEKKNEELGIVRAEADSLSAESARLDAEIAKRAQYEAEKKKIEEYEKILTSKLNTIDRLMANRDGAFRMFKELGGLIPDDAWLSSYSVTSSSVNFKGVALNSESVARFMKNVESSPNYFQPAPTQSERRDELTGRMMQEFEIQATRRVSDEP